MNDWPELARLGALVLGLALVAWGVWCTLGWAKEDWRRLRRWFED